MDRRKFLGFVGAASAAVTALPIISSDAEARPQYGEPQPNAPEAPQSQAEQQFPQTIPPDQITNNPGVEYYFVGNGVVACAVQICTNPQSGTPVGMILMQPQHFSRKNSSLLFHPEWGVSRTMITVITENTSHQASHDNITARYSFTKDFLPSIIVSWTIGSSFTIEEEFIPTQRQPAIIRRVRVKNNAPENRRVKVQAAYYPNPFFYDTLTTSQDDKVIEAGGYFTSQLYAQQEADYNQRWVTVNLGSFAPMEMKQMEFIYTAGVRKEDIFSTDAQTLIDDNREAWGKNTRFTCDTEQYAHIFAAASLGLRSVIAKEGKMDAGTWQYNAEWVLDSSAAAMACVYCGQFENAKQLLHRIMEHMVTDAGSPMEASRFVSDDMLELNQCGQLLYALWLYWTWTGDDIIDKYWKKVKVVTECMLKPAFVEPASGLLHNKREFWERYEAQGVQDGFELSHQVLCIAALEKLADYAAEEHKDDAAKWGDAAKKMKASLLNDPKVAMIDGGHFVKRKTIMGAVVITITPPDKASLPPGVPLATEDVNNIDPDATDVLPILYDTVDPNSQVAEGTLAYIEKLWNQRWDIGGYGRYDVTSEPDSPGPWTFATVMIARAYARAGKTDKVKQVLDWLTAIQGGKGGGWFEFYGSRPVPPLPPVGMVAYAWSEIAALFVREMLGVQPSHKEIIIAPKLLAGIKSIEATIRFRDSSFTLKVSSGSSAGMVNGAPAVMQNGAITIPLPLKEGTHVEMTV